MHFLIVVGLLFAAYSLFKHVPRINELLLPHIGKIMLGMFVFFTVAILISRANS